MWFTRTDPAPLSARRQARIGDCSVPAPRHQGRHVAARTPRTGIWSRWLSAPAGALAVVTAGSVGFAVWPHPAASTITSASGLIAPRSLGTVDAPTADREPGVAVSRSADRSAAIVPPARSGVETAPVPKATGHRWSTTDLNVWSGAGEDSTLLTVIPAGTRVAITGSEDGDWAQIVRAGLPRWVNAAYLSPDKPTADTTPPTTTQAPSPGSVSYAPCRLGSAVESGLTADAVRVYRAVCAAFPQVTSYGGLRPGDSGEHGTGQALDIMTSDQALGDAIAAWVIDHRSELGVSEVLWSQQIWTVERISEGWRTFTDRGSATANHEDHVHVTVYGDSGTG